MIGTAEAWLHAAEVRRALRVRGLGAEAAFAVACLVSIGLRFWVLDATGAPPGIDAGNWLAFGQALQGDGVGSSSAAYPPVVPLLVTWSATVLGVTAGVAIVAAASSAAPAAGAFLLLRWAGVEPRLRVVLAVLMLCAPGVGETAAWGGYPQLLAAPFLAVWLWHHDAWLHDGRRADLCAAAIGCACTFAISHFVVAVGIAAAAVVVVVRSWGDGTRGRVLVHRAAIAAAMTIAAAVPFLAVYLRVGTEYLPSYWESVDATRLGVDDIPRWLVDIYGPSWPFWTWLFAAGIAGLFLARHRFRTRLLVVALALLVAPLCLFVPTGEPRLIHSLEWSLPLLLAVWLVGRTPRTAWVPATAIAALTCASVLGAARLPDQTERYSVLDQGLLHAIEWIADNTHESSLIAVGPAGDAPLGWWVEGLTTRETIYAAPLRWLYDPDERRRAAVANEIFLFDGLDSAAGNAARDRLGVDYVLVAKDPVTSEPIGSPARTLRVVFENSSAVVLTDMEGEETT